METNQMPGYRDITVALNTLKALTEASESHGLLCALFCVGADVNQTAWIDSMLSDHVQEGDIMVKQATEKLSVMFETTRMQYQSDFFDFELLLPEDNAPFHQRIGALALWAQGFLAGIGLMGVSLDKNYSDEAREAIEDLTKISRLQFDDEQLGDEEDERSYSELVEYAKVASLLLHSECKMIKKEHA